jgi:hypothetical protein
VALTRSKAAVYLSLCSDSFFPYHLCITHKHEPPLGGVLHEKLEAENTATNSVRTSIKWTHGDIIILFHVMHETYHKKCFLSDCMIHEVLRQQLRVVFFIYNCYVCFNGNELTQFFDTPPPKLSDYLAH